MANEERWIVYLIRKYNRIEIIGATPSWYTANRTAREYEKLYSNERSYVGVGVLKESDYIKLYGEI